MSRAGRESVLVKRFNLLVFLVVVGAIPRIRFVHTIMPRLHSAAGFELIVRRAASFIDAVWILCSGDSALADERKQACPVASRSSCHVRKIRVCNSFMLVVKEVSRA